MQSVSSPAAIDCDRRRSGLKWIFKLKRPTEGVHVLASDCTQCTLRKTSFWRQLGGGMRCEGHCEHDSESDVTQSLRSGSFVDFVSER